MDDPERAQSPGRRNGRRLRCRVPFCTGSRGDRKGKPLPDDLLAHEWLCARHWAMVPKALRQRYQAARRAERAGQGIVCTAEALDGNGWPVPEDAAECDCGTCGWVTCRTRAIETAAGL